MTKTRKYTRLYEKPKSEPINDRYAYIEAPVPYCHGCKQYHIKIQFKPTSQSYRCEGCFSYGGPVMVKKEQAEAYIY